MNLQEFSQRYSYDERRDRLGKGGFGSVFKAYDNVLDCYVAIKIAQVDPDYDNLRLSHEVEKAARLEHVNVAHYDKCMSFKTLTGEVDIAIMQYYENGSLSCIIDNSSLDAEHRYDLLTQILEGIAYLHSEGIIHRDLKPQNVLIARRGDRYIPKITDFGISKQLDDGQSSAVSNSVLGGTRSYASPEQLKERTIRKNTDLWSFGVIAYQMLVGALPFDCGGFSPTSEEGRLELFRQMTSGVLPEALNNVPEPWQRLIRECLTVDNEKRIAHAEDCLAIIRGEEAMAVEVVVDNPATQLDGNSETAVEIKPQPELQPEPKVAPKPEPKVAPKQEQKPVSAFKPTEPKKKSKWWLWLLLLAIVGGGVFAYISPEPTPDPVSTSSTGIYAVGDYYNMNGVEGVVFEISDGGRHGKIVSVDQARLAWGPYRVNTPADSETNGKENTDAIMALSDRDSYPAFTWCRDKGPNWYLPAKSELQAMRRNKDAINATLRARGYTEIYGDWYWSSTESSEFWAWPVAMDGGYTNYYYKNFDFYVRAVSAF